MVEVPDARGDPEPARGAGAPRGAGPLTLPLAPSYAALCIAQAAVVAMPTRQASGRGLGLVWVLVPAALLGAGVAVLDTVSGGPHALALVATFGTPACAAAAGFLTGRRRPWLWPPAAAGLWLVAWQVPGLVGEAAGVLLIAAACLAIAGAASRVAPAWSIAAGLVVLAILDVILVWGTPQVQPATTALHAAPLPRAAGTPLPALQDATFGSALMGWLDLIAPALLGVLVAGRVRVRAALGTGVAAGLWGLLLFATSEVAATVPVVVGLLVARPRLSRD